MISLHVSRHGPASPTFDPTSGEALRDYAVRKMPSFASSYGIGCGQSPPSSPAITMPSELSAAQRSRWGGHSDCKIYRQQIESSAANAEPERVDFGELAHLPQVGTPCRKSDMVTFGPTGGDPPYPSLRQPLRLGPRGYEKLSRRRVRPTATSTSSDFSIGFRGRFKGVCRVAYQENRWSSCDSTLGAGKDPCARSSIREGGEGALPADADRRRGHRT
jgi:hypothetical protein